MKATSESEPVNEFDKGPGNEAEAEGSEVEDSPIGKQTDARAEAAAEPEVARQTSQAGQASRTEQVKQSGRRSTPLPGLVFIVGALERLQGTREGRRGELKTALERAVTGLRPRVAEGGGNVTASEASAAAEAAILACSGGATTAALALDCVEKLVSFGYATAGGAQLVSAVAGVRASGGSVDVQVVKALFALVSSERLHVRGAAMLAAVRAAYAVFAAARDPATQTIAQGTLTQMVDSILARAMPGGSDDEAARDAFLLVRALCRLAMRDTDTRARCLALTLLRLALADHAPVFTSACVTLRATGNQRAAGSDEFGDAEGPHTSETGSPEPRASLPAEHGSPTAASPSPGPGSPAPGPGSPSTGLTSPPGEPAPASVPLAAVLRHYLSLALSRSLVASDVRVLDLALGVFELALRHIRQFVFREIEVLFREIILPLLTSRAAASLDQRARVLRTLRRVLTTQELVVELYLNYDCCEGALNLFQRLAEILCKLAAAQVPPRESSGDDDSDAWRAVQRRPTVFTARSANDLPPSPDPSVDSATEPGERAVRQLSLDALAAMLQSMVLWSDRLGDPIPAADESVPPEPDVEEPADDPAELSSIKARKAQFEAGCRQFSHRPAAGVDAWRSAGMIESAEPQAVARFLYAQRDAIDKVQLGEYLGEGDAYNIAVMHTFIDQMEFTGMDFVPALRQLLQAFRLPGEAQKIDRFMLKFAERYIIGNPDAGFANADAAYVLAYSAILLNTDQHSAQVRRRMTRADFVANNRGINGGGDLAGDLLDRVFDQIASDEIKLKDDPLGARVQSAARPLFVLWGNSTADRIREEHAHASAEMAAKSEQSIRSMAQARRPQRVVLPAALLEEVAGYVSATRAEHIAPMFGAVWTACLAAISTPMQTSSDPHVVAACLVGLQCGIALASRFRMPLERATFVTTLRNFTLLQNLAEMRRKHVEAIRALVEVAASRPDVGDGLSDSWADVLLCVSQLERLQLLTQAPEPGSATRESSEASVPARAFFGSRSSVSVPLSALAKLDPGSQTLVVSGDRLFTASRHLSGAGIVDFVRALSGVAWGEIGTGGGRLFSMTKIVEIAYYNMDRIRVEWSQIWAILGPLFDRVGANPDERAALFALDSLRQLSTKFLEKEELPHFAFQKEFLRPFADVLEAANAVPVKDMVLRCVHQLVQAAASHIRSGWKAVLTVSQTAARDRYDAIAEMGFHLARECAEKHTEHMWTLTTARVGEETLVVVSGLEYFHELVACLSEYAVVVQRPRLALGAIDTLYDAGVALGTQVLEHPQFGAPADLDAQPLYRVWMPVLRALHDVVMHTDDLEVRTRALDAFFRLLMTQGARFGSPLWAAVLRSLVFPMFTDLRSPGSSPRFATVGDLELWFSTTLIKALRHLVALFSEYYPQHLGSAMMGEVLELLALCIAQPSEVLAKVGTSCLLDLVRCNYTKWDDAAWAMVCDSLHKLFSWSQPRELFSIAGAESAPEPELPVIAPNLKRQPSISYTANRPSPLRTAGSAASLLSTDGTASPGTPPVASPAADSTLFQPFGPDKKKPDYEHITLKCILQLLLIQTVGELFGVSVESGDAAAAREDVYNYMTSHHLFILLDCLDQSREFAARFNEDRKVRRRLVEMGVMPTMPSLLKQETGSVLVELRVLQRMHRDAIAAVAARETVVDEVVDRLAALTRLVFAHYCGRAADEVHLIGRRADGQSTEAKRRAVVTAAWRPCVLAVLEHVAQIGGDPLKSSVARVWPALIDSLGVAVDVGDRDVVRAIQRVLAVAGTSLKIASSSYSISS
ncbi:guanine nucleotide exchange protein for ADP-robosylation factor [Coemansia sp. RSA 552]|nr:guanine nucleotide exchange protein for ADP-robosylation factor [Coemansia sp. RSA 552]